MEIIFFEDFMENYNIKNILFNELDLQKFFNYPIYPRDSKIYCE